MTIDTNWVTAGVTIGVVLVGIVRNKLATASLERSFNRRIDSFQDVMSAKFEAVDAKFEAAHQVLLRVEDSLERY